MKPQAVTCHDLHAGDSAQMSLRQMHGVFTVPCGAAD